MKWLNDEEEQFEFYDVAVRFPNGVQDHTGFVLFFWLAAGVGEIAEN